MTPLHPPQIHVLRVRAAIMAAFPLLLAGVVEFQARDRLVVPGLLTVLAIIAAAALIVLWPPRRYRSWGYDFRDDELHVAHGVLTHVHSVVPFRRVQHLDIAQGPIERRYGVARLILHTAGTHGAVVALPGLAIEAANRMRDTIREHIREEPA